MTSFQERLDLLVEDYLARKITFDAFQRAYSACYADEVADANFTPSEIQYYGTIHERTEWTSDSPTAEERSYGWRNEAEFSEWLRMIRSNYRISP